MGFWKEMFSNLDEPAIAIRIQTDDDELLKEENRRLNIVIKKILEKGIKEEKIIDVDRKLLK